MTSSNSVLRSPKIETNATPLGARTIDPGLRAAIADARNSGFAEGHAAATREAALAAASALERATQILDAAIVAGREQLAATVAAQSEGLIALAVEIAKRVVGDLPPDAGTGLARKLELALEQVDDPELVVRVNPTDAATLASLFEHRADVTLIRDTTIREGDAVLSGRWAQGDLRMATAWELVAEELRG